VRARCWHAGFTRHRLTPEEIVDAARKEKRTSSFVGAFRQPPPLVEDVVDRMKQGLDVPVVVGGMPRGRGRIGKGGGRGGLHAKGF
jgi:hypothetical protein